MASGASMHQASLCVGEVAMGASGGRWYPWISHNEQTLKINGWNMEHGGLEDDFYFSRGIFSGAMLIFRGVGSVENWDPNMKGNYILKLPNPGWKARDRSRAVFILIRKCWIIKTVFLVWWKWDFENDGFLGNPKNSPRKCVTDFGSVLRKCRKGSIFLCGLFLHLRLPAHAMALLSAWAKSLLPLHQRHSHWRKWHINISVFRDGSDDGIPPHLT